MTKWQMMESYLTGFGHKEFTNRDVAEVWRITPAEASGLIQAYLDAQVSPRSKTKYVITRSGRTSKAVWRRGHRVSDAQNLAAQTADDLKCRVDGFVLGTLRRMGVKNPQAIPLTNGIANMLMATIELAAAASGNNDRTELKVAS